MPGFHWPELLVVVFIALLIFGPKRLPEMGSSIGRTIREFQRSFHEVGDAGKNTTANSALPAAAERPAEAAQLPSPAVPATTPAESGALPAQTAPTTPPAQAARSEPGE
jgi:sec-independent protein translocase protein TatA